ncbi:MAG: hypothetical protein ACKVW3_08060 [Phycisphaerales bacterium]
MNRNRSKIMMIAAALVLTGIGREAARAQQPAQIRIGGVTYEKLGTRQATELRMVNLLNPDSGVWGSWHLLAPFAAKGSGKRDLATALPPEAELPKMLPAGTGPDLNAEYAGKNGFKARWRDIGDASNRAVRFNEFDDADLNSNASGYLYTTITATKATSHTVQMGSDDGLRLWLNGKLLVDADMPRGMNPEDHTVRLDLVKGVNHVFLKVIQGAGSWEYQINNRPMLNPMIDAQLQYQLNRDFPPTDEERYYAATTIPVPAALALEVGGLDVLPAGASGEARPIVSTRRGEVWIVEGAYGTPAFEAKFKRFASGLHEPLGLAVRREKDAAGKDRVSVYCVQRGELTRMTDTNGDDIADTYEAVCSGWGVSGNYHEFAFGPKFDRDGNAWVTLNVGFCDALGKSVVPYRGWSLKVTPDGTMMPFSDGLRSPNGIGEYSDGAMFYLDNQGDFVGTNRMTQLVERSWAGHPASLRWRSDWKQGDADPPMQPATIWFPYKRMGQSAADFLLYPPASAEGAGRFGPFEGQIFVGDQTLCMVMRVDLEKIDGHYQGACFPFREALDSGVNRLCWGGDGSMFVGQTDRGWGSTGRLRYGLQRLAWTGQTPFEVRAMRITPDGFVLTFTRDINARQAGDVGSYSLSSYTYEYHPEYGSKEMDTMRPTITKIEVLGPRSVRLHIDPLRRGGMGYVHELAMPGVRDAQGEPLLHAVAYYTVQRVPAK